MTKEDRNLMRAMFLVLFSMLWEIASALKGVEVDNKKLAGLLGRAMEISRKEE